MISASNAAGLDDFRLPELDELLGLDVFGVNEGIHEPLEVILPTALKKASSRGATYTGSPLVSSFEARTSFSQDSGPGSAELGLEEVYSFLDLPSSASEQSGVFENIAGTAQGSVGTWFSKAAS